MRVIFRQPKQTLGKVTHGTCHTGSSLRCVLSILERCDICTKGLKKKSLHLWLILQGKKINLFDWDIIYLDGLRDINTYLISIPPLRTMAKLHFGHLHFNSTEGANPTSSLTSHRHFQREWRKLKLTALSTQSDIIILCIIYAVLNVLQILYRAFS